MSESKPMTRTQEIQKMREKLRKDLEAPEETQAAIDLEAILNLEMQYGVNSVGVIVVPFTPGSVTRVATRTPEADEIKRYRARVKPKKQGDVPSSAEASAELAAVTRVYPPRTAAGDQAWDLVLSQRPGLDTQLGLRAVALAVGSEEDEGKG